ncbi:hypothetical protein BJY00DRAFT_285913 [Aspergillus carlsbadensis]|nr:hypothetical protein BJY00DRAFT_285913 [Aspergillus carlsbadensis]
MPCTLLSAYQIPILFDIGFPREDKRPSLTKRYMQWPHCLLLSLPRPWLKIRYPFPMPPPSASNTRSPYGENHD